MRRVLKNPSHDAELREKGYVVLPCLAPDEVDSLRRELFALRPGDRFKPAGSDFHYTFNDTDPEYKRQSNEIILASFGRRTLDMLDDYALHTTNVHLKPAGARGFPPHQHFTFAFDPEQIYTTVSIWCPLVDVDETNGALQIVPGSHSLSDGINGVITPYFFHDYYDRIAEVYAEVLPMNAGECVVFDDRLIHLSGPNTSGEPRPAVQCLGLPREAQLALYSFDSAHPERGFEVFALDPSFFVEESELTYRAKLSSWPSLGFVPNNNKFLSEEEFAARLGRSAPSPPKPARALGFLRRFVGRR